MRNISLDTSARVSLRRFSLYVVLLIASCAPCRVPAQGLGNAPATPTVTTVKKVGDSALITWSAPSTYSDGTALGSVALTYTLYSAVPGAPWTVRSTGAGLGHTTLALPKGTQCFGVTVTAAGIESILSGVRCLNAVLAPSAPGTLAIQ